MSALIEPVLLGTLILITLYLARRADRAPRLATLGMWWIAGLGLIHLITALQIFWQDSFFSALPALTIALGLFLLVQTNVRRILARVFPIDPHRFLHTYLFSLVWIELIIALTTVTQPFAEAAPTLSLAGIFLQESIFILGSLLVVGLWNTVSFPKTLRSLGLKPLTWVTLKRAVLATLATYALLFTLSMMIGVLAQAIFNISPEEFIGNPPTTYQLLEDLISPATILIIPIIVAFGEEFVFRGVLQPFLGFIPTAIFFVLIHLPQNAFHPLTLLLFVPAFMLGWLRLRYNLTVAIVTHALYNAGLLALAFFFSDVEQFLA